MGRWRPELLGALIAGTLFSPVAAAAESGCQDIASRYTQVKREAAIPTVNSYLLEAAENGCRALVEELLANGASVAFRGSTGDAALHHAARGGENEIVALLVERGADINFRDIKGGTALFYAADANRAKTAKLLLDLGADPNLAGRSGVSSIEAAAFNGNDRVVELLLKHGADPGHVDLSGKSAIIYAAARGFTPIVQRLLNARIDVNTRYGNDLTALMWAAGYSNDVPEAEGLATVTLLLDNGARIDDRDNRGRSALMIASESGHAGAVDLLLKRGADAKLKDNSGNNASDLAASKAIKTILSR
jgi:ankyrin repeat protein